jgi:type IV secretory pathway VirB10-like protein
MATRKSKKKRAPLKKTATRNRHSSAKKTVRKKPAKKKAAPRKKAAAKTSPAKKKAVKKSPPKKTRASEARPPQQAGPQSRTFDVDDRELMERRSRSAGQSGDLQGLSGSLGVDSESVDELLEEGNSFEAGIVAGVEDAGNDEEKEIRTREVPEDDVPEEYLDKDE